MGRVKGKHFKKRKDQIDIFFKRKTSDKLPRTMRNYWKNTWNLCIKETSEPRILTLLLLLQIKPIYN